MADFVPVTKEGLRAAMRDPRYWGSGHPEREAYHRWVTEGWQALVREGQGKDGVVQVRAYTRTRNGKTEQVGEHSRADPPGGDAAAALGNEDRPVDRLVTVDRVGAALTDDDLRRVRAGSREWVNVRAYGAARDFSDFIAAVGRPYADRPRGYATQYMEVPRNHGNFTALLRYADPMGVSGFSRILGQ